jgi:hypothetical protein
LFYAPIKTSARSLIQEHSTPNRSSENMLMDRNAI